MPVDEPSWWYGEGPQWPARALEPVARVYAHIAARRMAAVEPYRSRLPVICIGNFTAGGTGKTPLALRIARTLQQLGRRPVFLTRGYGGRLRGPHRIGPGDPAALVGDEPLLLARVAPTVIARDRAAGARAIEAADGEEVADIIIMDDGLQNPHLVKDLTIAVVDGQRGLGNGAVIPAGPLRAPLAIQIGRTDAIVITRPNPDAPAEPTVMTALKQSFHGPVLAAETRAVAPYDWLRDQPLVAFCGIGAPRRFLDLLTRLGGHIAAEAVFPDHHAYRETDARRLLALAQSHAGVLVTTEKDWVRLTGLGEARGDLQTAARTLAIETVLAARDEERLLTLLRGVLAAPS
ncbi:MAG: tetraacyldisaccharide 4'-kinase [Hyphomicrobiaceae bacterium]